MLVDFETAVGRKQDYSTTLENLCEEFRVADEVKLQKKEQKRAKKKARRQLKTAEVRVCVLIHQRSQRNHLGERDETS